MQITNEDNMELMARYEDNHFNLAIVDPPYGIRIQQSGGTPTHLGFKDYKKKEWDNEIPNKEYFKQLFRVSKNQIIWGGNYFVEHLTKGFMGWIVWDKGQKLTMSDGELAYSSFNKALRIKVLNRCKIGEFGGSIHPTQKPVKLYEFCLMNYAKEGDKILDTHLGSGSLAIACHNLGFDLTACELDKEYYNSALKRIEQHKQQLRMF